MNGFKRIAALVPGLDHDAALCLDGAKRGGSRGELSAQLLDPSAADPADVLQEFPLVWGEHPPVHLVLGNRINEQKLLRLCVRSQYCGWDGRLQAELYRRAGIVGYPPDEFKHLRREERSGIGDAENFL